MSDILDTLVFDRTEADLQTMRQLRAKIAARTATATEKTTWANGMKGALNAADLNRMGDALRFLQSFGTAYNRTFSVTARNDFSVGEFLTDTDKQKFFDDIDGIVKSIGYPTFQSRGQNNLPSAFSPSWETTFRLTYIDINKLESILNYIQPTIYYRFKGSNDWNRFVVKKSSVDVYYLRSVRDLIWAQGYSTGDIDNIVSLGVDDFSGKLNDYPKAKELYFNSYASGASIQENNKQLETLYIGSGVTALSVRAFNGCTALKAVTIPSNVRSIYDLAFGGCLSLKTVTFDGTFSTMNIYTYAFSGSAIESIDFPAPLSTADMGVCQNCKSLSHVGFPDTLVQINTSAFSGCIALTDITYAGTMAQWANVTVGANAFLSVPATVVHCSDGDVAI